MSQACIIPHCEGEVKPGSTFKTCQNCRSSMGMWQRRGVAAVVVRRNTLNKYDTRMRYVATPPASDRILPVQRNTKAKRKAK